VAQADRSEGRRDEGPGGVSNAEREELIKLRREVRQLRLERDILSKAAAWFPSSGIPPADAGGTGGFKWSSQHPWEGSCDDQSKAAFGSIRAGAIVVTWSAAGGGTR
jgi:hypothetical protein